MTFDEYEKTGHLSYRDLASTVAAILGAAVATDPSLRLQQIQNRAKDPVSLQKKLKKIGNNGGEIAAAVKDLAGCRLVFYTNTDVENFLKSGALRDNFDIDWDRSKIHHPVPGQEGENGLFSSYNYVLKLKAERLALPEYARLAGFWCEVQVQTTLNHAWAEMAHDTIYKRPDTDGFGKEALAGIEERMNNIMRKYLLPAGYEFQKVAYDAERLAKGLELFDRDVLQEIAGAADNNARHAAMDRFVSYVLPHYDDPPGMYAEIRPVLLDAVTAARSTAPVAISTPFGEFSGKTSADIERLAESVFERLRYADVEASFDAACQLYLGAPDAETRKLWSGFAEKLAKNEMEVWRQVGPGVQMALVDRIALLPLAERGALKDLLWGVLTQVLNPDVSGTSSTWNTVTMHQGSVPASEYLAEARSKALTLLESMFAEATVLSDKEAIFYALQQATRTPYNSNYGDELLKLILVDSLRVVSFFTELADSLPFELRQKIEHELFFLYRRSGGGNEEKIEVAGDEHGALTDSILKFRDKIDGDPDFVIYKTLVGFESVFPPAWERDDFDFEADEAYRNEEIERYVEDMSADKAEKWLTIIQRCAATESNDLATFPTFGKFLQLAAARKPDIVIGYLGNLDERLSHFLPGMLIGLSEGAGAAAAQKFVAEWLAAGKYLVQIIRYLHFARPVDAALLASAFAAARQANDDSALLESVDAACALHGEVEGGLIPAMLIPAIEDLSGREHTRWVDVLWLYTRRSTVFDDLEPQQADVLLAGMVKRPQINFHAEDVLAALGRRWPDKILGFFDRRLARTEDADRSYDAVPFRLHRLKPSNDFPVDTLLDQAYAWYVADPALFPYRGGRVMAVLYPELSDRLSAALAAFATNGRPEAGKFVVRIVRAYHGEAFLFPLCRELVAGLPEGDDLLGEIEIALDSTGVVSGEFGFVHAYQAKKQLVEPWLQDERPAVREFALRYVRTLDRQIASEQRRNEEERELRKRNWGSGDQE